MASMGMKLGAGVAAVIGVAIVANVAKKSSKTPVATAQVAARTTAQSAPGTAADGPGINLECVPDQIRAAPAPFHYSFKKDTTSMGPVSIEADVSSDTISGTTVDTAGTRPIQGMRTDSSSWNLAVLVVGGPLPASTFALVNNSSARSFAGPDGVDGFDTVKYVFDTANDTTADAGLINSVMGPGGFIKGNVWVTRDGCPVKFALDGEMHLKDGSVDKEHYELAITKK
jgi:hypothetical protein